MKKNFISGKFHKNAGLKRLITMLCSLAVMFVMLPSLLGGCASKPEYFALRGMKGYYWTPEECLAQVPVLKEYGMNFFAPCYTSFYDRFDVEVFEELDGHNLWWEPLNEDLKERWISVIKACDESGINFCFGMNPMLFSPRPLNPASEEDFELLLAKYSWFQEQGVKWFYIAIDDLHLQSHLEIDAVGQSLFTNKLYAALKANDPDCKMIFCPTWYRGKDVDVPFKKEYLDKMAVTLDKDIFVFWVGYHTVSPEITLADVMRYKEVVKHEMILWDNYPVNDFHNTMNVEPLTGREGAICEALYGMMANPMRDREMTNLPLYTMADFMNNPYEYDPAKSIAAAIDRYTDNAAQANVLESLIALYSSNLNNGIRTTKYSYLRAEFERMLSEDRAAAEAYMERLQGVGEGLNAEFPDRYGRTKEIVAKDMEWMKSQLE